MKEIILKNALLIHSGTISQKFLAVFNLAAFPAVGFSLVETFSKWYLDNHVIVFLIVGAIICDLFIGVWKHLKLHTFSPKKMLTGFCEKAFIILIGYFLSESLVQILSDADFGTIYIKIVSRLMIFTYPAMNAFVNMGIITNGKFPPLGLIQRFEKFNKHLDPTAFKFNNDNPQIQDDENTYNGPV